MTRNKIRNKKLFFRQKIQAMAVWSGFWSKKNKFAFPKNFSRRSGAIAVLIIFLAANLFQNFNTAQGYTFLFNQTDWSGDVTANNATHPGNGTGWDEYSEGTNVVTTTPGQATLSEATHENFSETFTADTFKDAVNTDANWNTSGGQIEFPTETAGTDLYEKLNGYLAGSTIQATLVDGSATYVGSSTGKFLKYDASGDTVTNLTAKISGAPVSWSTAAINSLVLDSANNVVYIAGSAGKFARYQTSSWAGSGTCADTSAPYAADAACELTAKISGAPTSWGTTAVQSLVLDSANSVVYLAGGGKFARYNTDAYVAGGTYPTADTSYLLTSKISAFFGSVNLKLVFNSTDNTVYIGGGGSQFARYNTTFNDGLDATYPTADTGYDLTSKISSFWTVGAVQSLNFDSASKAIYLGGQYGRFVRYNTTAYTAAGTYPNADTAYDLASKIVSVFSNSSSTNIYSLVFDDAENVMYLGGISSSIGKLARYNTAEYVAGGTYPTADTGYDLTAKISSFQSASSVNAISFDSANGVVYIAGGSGTFGRYNTTVYVAGGTYSTADTAYDFTSRVDGIGWGANLINSAVSAGNNEFYFGGVGGKFGKYNNQTGVATGLTAKISSFWSTLTIESISFDSVNNVIYLAGANGKLARYQTSSWSGSGTCAATSAPYAADEACNLTAKISSFWSTSSINTLSFDATNNVIYLAGLSGKFARYQTSSWAGSGTCAATGVAYAADAGCNLTAKISSFWSTTQIEELSLDSENDVLYLGGESGKFARYQTSSWAGSGTCAADAAPYAADSACDLTAKISSFWSTNIIYSFNLDSANDVLYLGGQNGKLARYQTSSWTGSGTCAADAAPYAADAACNLTAKISSFWSTSSIFSFALDSANNSIYLGGVNGAFARYSITGETALNLRSPDLLSFWASGIDIYSVAIDSEGNVYIGGESGYFAKKPANPSIAHAYSTAVDGVAYNIYYATLTKNDTVGTGTIAYQLSNDGGATWESVTPGVNHTFSSVGSDLRFKIAVTGNATVQDVSIEYWSINASGSLVSSKFNATDVSNTLAKIRWTESLPAGTDLKFQMRTSGDGSSWTAWCGPDDGVGGSCSSATYFTNPAGTETVDDINSDQANDQWIQYKAFLTSDGLNTPTLSDTTLSYVVNAVPEVQSVTASQGSDGLVTVDYEIRDPDTDTGATQNELAITLQYCTADCSGAGTWADATAPALTGDFGAGISAQEVAWTAHQLVWNPTVNYDGQYNATDFKVRIKAFDGELANHTGYGISGIFTLDTTEPTLQADTLMINDSASAVTPQTSALTLKLQNISGDAADETVYAQFSRDGLTWYGANGEGTLASAGDWGTGFALDDLAALSWSWTMASRSETITVRIKDGYGNSQVATDTNSSQYNAYPEIQNVTASQGATGTVTVNYEARDADTATAVSPGNVAATLQYCTADCSNPGSETWEDAAAVSGDAGAGIDVEASAWTAHQIVWTVKTDYDEEYNAVDFKVRMKIDDSSLFNNLDYAQSASFTLDTKDPTNVSVVIDHSTEELTMATPSDDSTYQLGVSNVAGTFSSFEDFASPYAYDSMTSDPATVYVRIKDAYGNYTDASATTPARPTNPVYFDISSPGQGTYQEFVAWDVISAAQTGSGFDSYKVYRKIDSGSYSLLSTITDRNLNYVLDRIQDTNPDNEDSDPAFDPQNPSTYYYKIIATDTDGNRSVYSTEINDAPDGVGGSDTTAPTISDVAVSNINTTSAKVTWTTDELSDSSVGYSADTTYLPERGLSSMVLSHEIVLTGLTPGSTYNIRVKSHDVVGNLGQNDKDAPGSSPIPNFTFETHPGPAISQVTVPNISNHQATITWKTTTDSNTYVVYSDTVVDGALVDPEEVGSPTLVGGSAPHSHTQTISSFGGVELSANTTYYFYVKSIDGSSNMATDDNGGNFYQILTTEDTEAPIISGVNAAIINNTETAINWTTDEPATSVVEYGTTEGGPYPLTGSVLTYNNSHYVILTGLDPVTTYYYTVTSADINTNSDTSAEYSFTTLNDPAFQHEPLSAISGISDPPSALTDTKAVISFTTDQAAQCVIEFGTASGNYNETPATESGFNETHSMHLPGLIFETQYFYQITCADNLENTVSSAEFSFTTLKTQVDQHDPLTAITNISDPLPVITDDKAVITFDTDQGALCEVDYGTATGDYGAIPAAETDYNGNHAIYLSGLTADTPYFYQISCADDLSNSVQSAEGTFTTLKDPEFQHEILSEITSIAVPVITDDKAVVAFNTDQAALCSVDYGTATGDYGATPVAETDYNGNHAIYLPTLAAATPYFYQITCADNLETEIISAEQTFTTSENLYTESEVGSLTDIVAPVISGVSSKVNTGESVTVNWDTDEAASSYVQYGIVSGTYTDMAGDPLINNDKTLYDTAHAVIMNGLTPGIKYYYTVISHDRTGNIAESSESTFTTGASSSLSSINIISASLGEALITWKTSAKTSSLVEYGVMETYGQKKEDTTAVTEHSVTINGLTAAQLYHLRVGGKDANGQRYSSGDYTFTPKSPPQIGLIGVKDITEHSATVSFTTDFPTEFNVTYTSLANATDSGSKGKPDFSTSHEITLDKLKPGTTYSLKVKSTDEQGNSVDKLGPNFTTGKDENAPEIKQTRTESALAQNDKVQTIISWETNELSTCKLVYREGSSGEEKEYKLSDRPVMNHVAVVTSFKSGTVYYFKIKSIDEAGNEATSSEYALLTPQKKENIVQIIVNNFQDIFSWTSRVGG